MVILRQNWESAWYSERQTEHCVKAKVCFRSSGGIGLSRVWQMLSCTVENPIFFPSIIFNFLFFVLGTPEEASAKKVHWVDVEGLGLSSGSSSNPWSKKSSSSSISLENQNEVSQCILSPSYLVHNNSCFIIIQYYNLLRVYCQSIFSDDSIMLLSSWGFLFFMVTTSPLRGRGWKQTNVSF